MGTPILWRRVLVHLSRGGAEVQLFAPDVPQLHVIDHTKGQPAESETRWGCAPCARVLARLGAMGPATLPGWGSLSTAVVASSLWVSWPGWSRRLLSPLTVPAVLCG